MKRLSVAVSLLRWKPIGATIKTESVACKEQYWRSGIVGFGKDVVVAATIGVFVAASALLSELAAFTFTTEIPTELR